MRCVIGDTLSQTDRVGVMDQQTGGSSWESFHRAVRTGEGVVGVMCYLCLYMCDMERQSQRSGYKGPVRSNRDAPPQLEDLMMPGAVVHSKVI